MYWPRRSNPPREFDMISDRAIRAALDRFRLASDPTGERPVSELQIVLDASLSMTSGDGSKDQLAREVAILLMKLAQAAGWPSSVCLLRGEGRHRTFEVADVSKVVHAPFDGSQSLVEIWGPETTCSTPGARRVVVSDFLFPDDPTPLLRLASEGIEKLWLLQLLDAWELEPIAAGPIALIDVESEETVEVMLDLKAIEHYRGRLSHLRETLANACQSVGASLVTVSADTGLVNLCSDWLVPAGLLHDREVQGCH